MSLGMFKAFPQVLSSLALCAVLRKAERDEKGFKKNCFLLCYKPVSFLNLAYINSDRAGGRLPAAKQNSNAILSLHSF